MGRTKNRSKKDINTNGYKIQIKYKNIEEIEYFTFKRAPRNNCRFEFINLVEFILATAFLRIGHNKSDGGAGLGIFRRLKIWGWAILFLREGGREEGLANFVL